MPAAPAYEKVPWTVSSLDPQERLWPYSRGQGVTVAVVSTGVNTTHPQLSGVFGPANDLLRNSGAGMDDCDGQGTAIASVIAAQPAGDTGFVGLAPDAKILPVRVAENAQVVRPTDKPTSPQTVASGIKWAVAQGAEVIVVAPVIFADDPTLKAAVEQAQAAGAVIVAPVGDDHPKDPPLSEQPTPADRIPYPAAYDGVIGIGAVGPNGLREPASEVGDFVDLVAPGESVVVANPNGGHATFRGTGIAVAFGGAAAALLLGQPGRPWASASGTDLSFEVEARLRSTGSPVSGHFGALGYGGGMVDPGRAMTDLTNDEAQVSAQPYVPPSIAPEAAAHARFEATSRSRAIGWTWGALGALAAACVGYLMLRGVYRNQGRALSSPQISESERDQELKYVPGEKLFAPPSEPS